MKGALHTVGRHMVISLEVYLEANTARAYVMLNFTLSHVSVTIEVNSSPHSSSSSFRARQGRGTCSHRARLLTDVTPEIRNIRTLLSLIC